MATGRNKHEALHNEKGFLSKASPKLRQRLVEACERIRQKGLDPRDVCCPIVVDIDAKRARWMLGRPPGLARARVAIGHYLLALGRRFTLRDGGLLSESACGYKGCPSASATSATGTSTIGSSGR